MKKINFSKALFLGILAASVVLTSCDTKTTTQTPVTTTFVDSLNNTTWISNSVALATGASAILGSDFLTPLVSDTFQVTTLNATTVVFTPKTKGKKNGTLGDFTDTFSVNTTLKSFTATDFVANQLFKDSNVVLLFDSTTTPARGYIGGLYDSLKGLTDSLGVAVYIKFDNSTNPNALGPHKNYFMKYQNAKSIALLAPFSITVKIYKNKFRNPLAAINSNGIVRTLFGIVFTNPLLLNQVGAKNLTIPEAAVTYGFVKQ